MPPEIGSDEPGACDLPCPLGHLTNSRLLRSASAMRRSGRAPVKYKSRMAPATLLRSTSLRKWARRQIFSQGLLHHPRCHRPATDFDSACATLDVAPAKTKCGCGSASACLPRECGGNHASIGTISEHPRSPILALIGIETGAGSYREGLELARSAARSQVRWFEWNFWIVDAVLKMSHSRLTVGGLWLCRH